MDAQLRCPRFGIVGTAFFHEQGLDFVEFKLVRG